MDQTDPDATGAPPVPGVDTSRISGIAAIAVYILGAAGLLLAINQVFLLNLFGFQPLGNSYLYYLIGIFLAIAFITIPARRSASRRVDWFDWVLSALTLIACGYLGLHGIDIIQQGWEFSAPTEANFAAGMVLLATLEGVRRGGGPLLLGTALLFGSYPLFADYMPGFLWGTSFSFTETIRIHVLGVESIIGIPMQVVAELVIGFVIFGSVLTATKGADFFMDLATALLGRSRGGPPRSRFWAAGYLGRYRAV